jgi:signal transduction histidine kinase
MAVTFEHEIDPKDEEIQLLLKLISQQAAIIISKAKLYQDMEQTLDNIANFEQMKTAFIAITSHELRTPLGVIIGYATYLQNLVSSENKEFVDAILNSAVRLKEIIEDTRTLKNFQNDQATVHLKNSKINLLLEDVVKANSFLAYNDNIKISMKFPPNDVKANIDKEKFTTAMDHLIRNALLFNKQNGMVKVILEEDDNFFTVSILDSGIGIPEEDLDKIFDRFYQVSSHLTRNIGGMGLGLSICKSIVEMHHGQISVQSVLGRGSRFIVMLPKNPEILANKKS